MGKARRVPQLGGEVAIAFDAAFGELDVTPLRFHRGERETQRIGAILIDENQGIDGVPLGFTHLLALGVAHQAVAIHRAERHIIHEMQPLHHHAGHPEEDDVETGHQHIAGIMAGKVGRLFRPAERAERPQRRREPRVEHVFVAGQDRIAGLSLCFCFGFGNEHAALGRIPRRNPVPPPQLARHAPGLDILHPIEIGLFPGLRHELGSAVMHGGERILGEFGGVHIPLVGQPRLDHHAGTVAIRHLDGLLFDALDQFEGFEIGHHLFPRVFAGKAHIIGGHAVGGADAGFGVEDVDPADGLVAFIHLPVVEIMGWRDLHRTRTQFRIGMFIGDDRNAAAGDRQQHMFADDGGIARIIGAHGHGGIAQHGFGPRSGNDDMIGAIGKARAIRQRIADVGEAAGDFAGFHFQIGNRGLQLRIPVHQPFVAIEQFLVVELNEHLEHGLVEAVVHGETLVLPIARRAQPPELAGDGAAGFGLPFPHLGFERRAAHGGTAGLLGFGQLAFHHHLGGDAGVISADNPARIAAIQPVPADQQILQRVVERVADVQAARDVRRRDDDGERLGIRAGRPEAGVVFPMGIPTLFKAGRVENLVDHGHGA